MTRPTTTVDGKGEGAMTRVRACRGTAEYVIQPHSWQAYGRYDSGEVFATAVRASNPYMAADAVRPRMLAAGTITHLAPIRAYAAR